MLLLSTVELFFTVVLSSRSSRPCTIIHVHRRNLSSRRICRHLNKNNTCCGVRSPVGTQTSVSCCVCSYRLNQSATEVDVTLTNMPPVTFDSVMRRSHAAVSHTTALHRRSDNSNSFIDPRHRYQQTPLYDHATRLRRSKHCVCSSYCICSVHILNEILF